MEEEEGEKREEAKDLEFFQANPACLVSCSHDGSARVWDIRAADASARRFAVTSSEVYSCSVGRGDSALACAASEKVHLFDAGQGKRLCVYKDCHTDVVNHVRFHPVDTSRLLTGAEDNLVVLLDTNQPREDESMLGVIPNEECVRSFTLVGPGRGTLCCVSTTDDVRIWGLGGESLGAKQAEFLGLRFNELLVRDDGEAFGYVVETFYDEPSGNVFLLAGAGCSGELLFFRMTLQAAVPAAGFRVPTISALQEGGPFEGHSGIVRSALCLSGGVVLTAGEDGRVCAWSEDSSLEAQDPQPEAPRPPRPQRFGLEPSSYGVCRGRGAAARAAPY
ncbi:unnamed protein product [Prorocentrum cordatum]|uniref:Target of rapamycin complex subunit LST8 n=1 Tax=Prorocentrum cordatum TaxID=2364126 RepID=A0ABN9PFP4_9DINO|nr:unnamed protein product [Polarella glacialis]